MTALGRILDTIFPYPTPKIARIKDSRLGLFRYFLMSCIIAYVGVYVIMYKGQHLDRAEVMGVYQMQLAHPTQNNCNPMDVLCMQNFSGLATLPYCAQSAIPAPINLPCEFRDAFELRVLTDEGMLIPTHFALFRQTRGCKPSALNNWTCEGWLYNYVDKKGDAQLVRGQAQPLKDVFIADVERFTLRIDHSVRAHVGHRQYDLNMKGYLLECDDDIKGHGSSDACNQREMECRRKDGCPSPRTAEERMLDDPTATIQSIHPVASELQANHKVHPSRDRDGQPLALMQTVLLTSKRASAKLSRGPSNDTKETLLQRHAVTPQVDPQNKSGEAVNEAKVNFTKAVSVSEAVSPIQAVTPEEPELLYRSTDEGDLFTLASLLKAANVTMDHRRHGELPSYIGGSFRSSGFVLVIRIEYSNEEPWLGLKTLPWSKEGPPLHYTYRITKHASREDYMYRKVRKGESPDDRFVEEYHGIRILMEQGGIIAIWNNVQLLLVLTTTLALMAVASCITDTTALYLLPESDEYWAIKYERPRKGKEDEHGDPDRLVRTDSLTM